MMIYLFTGGSGSGKSAYAEEKICSFGDYNRIYIATMETGDAESKKRVIRHRKQRAGLGFTTIEKSKNLKEIKIPPESVALLECLSNLVANEMYSPDGAGENTVNEVLEGIFSLDKQAKELVVVTNEVFSDLPLDEEMQRYLDYLGQVNIAVAREAKEAAEIVYGIPVFMKR